MTINPICIQGVDRLEIESDTAAVNRHAPILDPSCAVSNREPPSRVAAAI